MYSCSDFHTATQILSMEASYKEYGTRWGIKALPRHLRRW